MTDLPTAAERADAVDRLMAKTDQSLAMLFEAAAIVRERQPSGSSACPLFPFIDREMISALDAARDALWKARGIAAKHGYEQHRKAGNLPSLQRSEA